MTCPICLDDYNKRTITTKCNHTFCVDCLLLHISKTQNHKNKCPLCRSEYFPQIINKKTNKIERRYLNRELYLYQQDLIDQQLNNNLAESYRIDCSLLSLCGNNTIKLINNHHEKLLLIILIPLYFFVH